MKWIACSLLAAASLFSAAPEPNPPTWPDNVIVLTPGQGDAQSQVDNIYHDNGGHIPPDQGQFSSSRYAILFMPGNHELSVHVGYYTSLIGLGSTPSDTNILQIACDNGDHCYTTGALNNFWRSCENLSTDNKMLWAVSQGAMLRRMEVNAELDLSSYNGDQPPPPLCPANTSYNAGFASGGFMADCTISGKVISGSQQQFLSRNCDIGQGWSNGVWNMVFLGCNNAPPSHTGNQGGQPYTTIASTPVIAEKPYISFEGGRYYLNIPNLETDKIGPTAPSAKVEKVDFSSVYVATEKDTAAVINQKIAAGLHIVLCPGNYELDESIEVSQAGICILGIGYPTLIASATTPCVKVGDFDGVKIAGILLQAGTRGTSTLLEWGTGYQGNENNPGFLYDCFARVGGPNTEEVSADEMIVLNNGHIIGDNLWLWRADHDVNGIVKNGDNPCQTGIVVNGDNVTMYGLAVEHTLGNLTEWNGEGGQVYFYQSEYPYDVTSSYTGISYKVADNVTSHNAWGVGVYCFFRDHPVTANSGIEAPDHEGVQFTNSLTVFLNGLGEIAHVINDTGDAVTKEGDQSYVGTYPPAEEVIIWEGNCAIEQEIAE